MKFWRMIKNMLMEVSEFFIVGINKKISIMLKSIKAYVILRLGPIPTEKSDSGSDVGNVVGTIVETWDRIYRRILCVS